MILAEKVLCITMSLILALIGVVSIQDAVSGDLFYAFLATKVWFFVAVPVILLWYQRKQRKKNTKT